MAGAKETAPKAAGKANSKRNSNSNSTDDLAGSGTFDRTPSKDVLDEPDKEGSAQGVPKSPSSGGFDMAKLKSKMGKKGECSRVRAHLQRGVETPQLDGSDPF
jgi:hypothetical protein